MKSRFISYHNLQPLDISLISTVVPIKLRMC